MFFSCLTPKEQIAAPQLQRDQDQDQAVALQEQLNQANQVNALLQADANQVHQAQVPLGPLLDLLKGNLSPGAISPAPGQSFPSVAQAAAATPKQTKPAQVTTAKVNAVIDAILAFNNTPGRSQGEK